MDEARHGAREEVEVALSREPVDAAIDPLQDAGALGARRTGSCTRNPTSRSGITPEPTGRHQCDNAKRVIFWALGLSPRRRVASDA